MELLQRDHKLYLCQYLSLDDLRSYGATSKDNCEVAKIVWLEKFMKENSAYAMRLRLEFPAVFRTKYIPGRRNWKVIYDSEVALRKKPNEKDMEDSRAMLESMVSIMPLQLSPLALIFTPISYAIGRSITKK